MRKITQQAVEALENGQSFFRDNTMVKDGKMYLHGSKIAYYQNGTLHISFCGYQTNTTKERINGAIPKGGIYQKKGKLYYTIDHSKSVEVDPYLTYSLPQLIEKVS